jgi:hypothetical protein
VHLGWRWLAVTAVAVTIVSGAGAQLGTTSGAGRDAARPAAWLGAPLTPISPAAVQRLQARPQEPWPTAATVQLGSAGATAWASAATVQLASLEQAPPTSAKAPAPPAPAATDQATDIPPPVRTPPWWSGQCDVNDHPGSFPLSSWDGLTACAPGPNRGGYDQAVLFFPGAWGQYEWECVELSMRWMYLAYGVHPYPANGGQVVGNYSPADGGDLHAVANDGASVPLPGDVLSMGGDYQEGHTAVVTATHVVHGSGWITVLEQNADGGDGINTIGVYDDVVEPEYGFSVTGWLAPPPRPAAAVATGILEGVATGNRILGPSLDVLAAGSPATLAQVRWAAAHAPAQQGAWSPGNALGILLPEEPLFVEMVGLERGS